MSGDDRELEVTTDDSSVLDVLPGGGPAKAVDLAVDDSALFDLTSGPFNDLDGPFTIAVDDSALISDLTFAVPSHDFSGTVTVAAGGPAALALVRAGGDRRFGFFGTGGGHPIAGTPTSGQLWPR